MNLGRYFAEISKTGCVADSSFTLKIEASVGAI
jgi:hypothetical protein